MGQIPPTAEGPCEDQVNKITRLCEEQSLFRQALLIFFSEHEFQEWGPHRFCVQGLAQHLTLVGAQLVFAKGA